MYLSILHKLISNLTSFDLGSKSSLEVKCQWGQTNVILKFQMAINQSVFNRFASNLTCGIFVQVYIKLWNFTQIDYVTSGYHDDKNWYSFFAITFVTFVIETSNWCQNDRLSILDTLVCYSTLSVYTDFKLLRFEGSGGQTLNLHIRIKCRRGLSCPALLVCFGIQTSWGFFKEPIFFV